MSALVIMLCLFFLSLTGTTVPNPELGKVRWLQSEDDEPAVKISSVIAVLSLTMQPYLNVRTDYAKWITGIYFCCAICSDFSNVLMLFLYL